MRRVFGQGLYPGRPPTFQMDIWKTTDGRLLLRLWSQPSRVDGRALVRLSQIDPAVPVRSVVDVCAVLPDDRCPSETGHAHPGPGALAVLAGTPGREDLALNRCEPRRSHGAAEAEHLALGAVVSVSVEARIEFE